MEEKEHYGICPVSRPNKWYYLQHLFNPKHFYEYEVNKLGSI